MIKLTDSIAPEACTVLDMAQVCRDELIAFAIWEGGQHIKPYNYTIGAIDSLIGATLYEAAITKFKDWARDTNRFYNADKARAVLDTLIQAVVDVYKLQSVPEARKILTQLSLGNPQPMMDNVAVPVVGCIVGDGMDYVTSPPEPLRG